MFDVQFLNKLLNKPFNVTTFNQDLTEAGTPEDRRQDPELQNHRTSEPQDGRRRTEEHSKLIIKNSTLESVYG